MAKSLKVKDFWKGNNMFILDGKFIMGPQQDVQYVYMFLGFIFLVCLIFYLLLIPNVVLSSTTFLVSAFSISIILFLVFYILTVITEPGYLPHQNLLLTPEYINANNPESQRIIRHITNNPNYRFTQ